ncbi:MAG: flagellar biosynthesis anti-sigma factor FlgM [Proteobacteria bacterium]|nr:flagellar biosynthesis anti-sigma factor FlgM [Pseudomonadota bacterium]
MKINDYVSGKVNGAYAGETSRADFKDRPKSGEQTSENGKDVVQLSERSREVARVRELVQSAPEVRAEKVAEVKARVESGEYEVPDETVAGNMIKNHIVDVV